uniref:P-type ATPase C-terminal domain-containing protein n=1 Tax=Cafeteria roenbergensis TaxID=33653 RepID=A0A7S0PFX1_CAFRO|mmetsp:Transcript_2710/g.10837  ORF Transcript_2710/g.10837 Transcript_2710/m.10837 type:complete len:1752 (+) Transcript_2710:1376-6631(+)
MSTPPLSTASRTSRSLWQCRRSRHSWCRTRRCETGARPRAPQRAEVSSAAHARARHRTPLCCSVPVRSLVSAAITARLGPCMRDLAKVEGSLLAAQGTGPKSPTSPPAGTDAPPIAASTKGNACVLLRECRLRNCERVYGLVAYTGPETFIKQQAKKTPAKPVFLSSAINAFVRIMLAVQIILCLVGATGFTLFASMDGPSHWYLGLEFSGVDFLLRFLTYMQISSNIIPISLYVSMEMARFAQRFFMERDDDMLLVTPDATEPNIPCKVRSLQLNDQLGQVTHIFSDKTGTLTRNSFEFRKLSVGGVEYGRGTTTIGLARLRRSANASDSASRAAVTTPTDPAAVTAAEVAEAERMLDEGERAVRALPHVNFLDGVTVPAAAGGGPGAPQCRSLAGDLGVPAAATASVRTPASRGGSYGSLGKTPSPRDSLHSSPPPLMSQAWLEAAGAASMGGPHSLACPGSGRWAEAHVALGAAAGGGADEHGTPLRLADASASDHSLSARGHDTERSASEAAIDAVVRDAGRTPIAALPPPARAALGVELRHFFLNLALDHSVELESRKDESGRVTSVGLSASSPDEEAFVAMAALAGWEFVGRSKGQSRLLLPDGRTRSFATVAELPYTQSRRMMSVLIEMPDAPAARDDPGWADHGLGRGKYAVYCKGADSRIAELAAGGPNARGFAAMAGVPESSLSSKPERAAESHNACVQGATEGHMNAWAADGLRTLAFAWRPLSRHWVEEDCGVGTYDAWRARCEGARGKTVKPTHASSGPVGWKRLWSLVTEDQENKKLKDLGEPNAIDDAMGVLERALRMQGATGIEDRLQAGVPEAVAALRDAGIKVYMLTGDKRATAVNIGFAVQLLTEEHLLVELTKDKLLEDAERARGCGSAEGVQRFGTAMMRPPASDDADDVDAWLAAVVRDQLQGLDPERTRGRSTATSQPLALVLDDPVLAALTGEKGTPDETQQQQMRALARRVMESAESVVCCRCSPAHKKAVVRLIKYGPQGGRSADRAVTTLAIGDGANDVEMIMEASVGVGVQGAEGAQAANSADYAIGQFRFLQRLLLVHGRWNYRRMALLVLFLFYKNALFTVAQFLFGIDSAWSGQKLYGEVANQAYNLFFTGAAVVAVAVLDQDVDQDSAQRFPSLYNDGRRRLLFNPVIATAWLLNAVAEATIIYLIVVNTVGASEPDGFANSIFEMGAVALTLVIAVVNLRLAAETYQHEWVFIALSFLSTASWPGLAFAADALDVDRTLGLMAKVWSSPMAWLLIPVGVFIVMTPVIVAKVCISIFMPSYATVVRETEFFIRKGQQSLQFAPMVETAETVKLRLQGKLTPEARRLRRASGLFDRANFATKTTIRMERGLDRVKEQATVSAHGVADSSSGTVSSKSRRFQDDGGGALVQAGNSSALSLVRRAAERRDGRPKKAATSVVSRRSSRVAPTPPPTGHRAELLRWAEQEALLILHPIEAELEERLRGETRTRLSYPFHFYRSVAMRKRIANLVQQGRIPAEAVGLRALPDDDVVFGEGADGQVRQEPGAARGDGAAAAASAAAGQAPGAAAPKPEGGSEQWKALRMAMRLSAIAKELAEGGADYRSTVGRSGDLRHARKAAKGRHRYTASQANRAAQRWATLRHGSRDIRAEFAVDESGQSGRAQQVQESVSRALHRAATSGRATTGQLGAGWRLPAPRRSAGSHSHSRKAATDAGASSAAAAAAAAAGPRTDPASMTSAGADLGARASDQATVSGAAGVGHE